MRVQVLSPIVVDGVQHNRGEILCDVVLTPLQKQSVHVIEDAPAAQAPVNTGTSQTSEEEH